MPHNRGFTLIEFLILIAVVAFLGFIVLSWPASAEDIDRRVPVFITGVTVGPWIGGNSSPRTGTGVPIILRHRDRAAGTTPDATYFMDWRALQSTRAHHAAAAVLEGLNFRFDSAEIEQRYETDLDFVARLLLDNPEVSLTLAGHTDLVGTAAYNDVLADRRADSVLNALVERGVPAERLTTTGFGESVPTEMILGPSITNRRVEVIPSLSLP